MQNRTPSRPVVPDFTPVPRKFRHDGWTPERQRGFISALADTGSVSNAAHMVNMSPEGAYHLRRQPGAESFCAAWEAALDHGVTRLRDALMERAIDGVPVPIMHAGEKVGEKRVYNDRLGMFILRHHEPDKYGEGGRRDGASPATRAALRRQFVAELDAEAKEKEDEIRRRILDRIDRIEWSIGEHRRRGEHDQADAAQAMLTFIDLRLQTMHEYAEERAARNAARERGEEPAFPCSCPCPVHPRGGGGGGVARGLLLS